jgi:hypothetical protein
MNLIERVARFADIDTRLALGIPPGRLPKTDFNPLRMMPTTFRYFPALKKIIYINFDESYDVYCWEVFEDIEPLGDVWIQGPNGRNRGVWRGLDDFMYFDKPGSTFEFYFAGRPEIVS